MPILRPLHTSLGRKPPMQPTLLGHGLACAGLLIVSCGTPNANEADICWIGEAVPSEPTPQLPEDACDDPPSAMSSVAEAVASAAAKQATAIEAELFAPERITVITCGTGSPIPSDRAQSCTAVFAGGQVPPLRRGRWRPTLHGVPTASHRGHRRRLPHPLPLGPHGRSG